MMRKTTLVLLSAAAGAAVMLFVTQPRSVFMGSTAQVASILAANASQPVLYIEFRKDGTPIDPGPWWAANEGEKVRG